jgi:hypothetical protein
VDATVELVIRLRTLMQEVPRLKEIETNLLMLREGAVSPDALMREAP